MAEVLNEETIDRELSSMSDWRREEKTITKDYTFKDFNAALKFVNSVGAKAEQLDHHPDILLHGWNKVQITVSTHSAGGVTEKDIGLARDIDSIET